MKALTIGMVARRAGIGVGTVRFYEREGLLERPARRESGYRQYGEEVVARLRFIRRAKDLGFTLSENRTETMPNLSSKLCCLLGYRPSLVGR